MALQMVYPVPAPVQIPAVKGLLIARWTIFQLAEQERLLQVRGNGVRADEPTVQGRVIVGKIGCTFSVKMNR